MTPSKEYEYRAPDLDQWLAGVDVVGVTLREAFEAGERYGADLERGALHQALAEYEDQAGEYGWSLVEYVRYRLIVERDQELPSADTTEGG